MIWTTDLARPPMWAIEQDTLGPGLCRPAGFLGCPTQHYPWSPLSTGNVACVKEEWFLLWKMGGCKWPSVASDSHAGQLGRTWWGVVNQHF